MINSGQFVNGIWMGAVLILFGLAPEILKKATDAMSSFPSARLFRVRASWRLDGKLSPPAMHLPRWLALLGIAIILLSTLAYIA